MGDLKKPPVQGGSEDDSIRSYSETSSKFSGNEKTAPVVVVHLKGAFLSSRTNQTLTGWNTEFLLYCSEWRHAKILIDTCVCWFLLDIAYVLILYIRVWSYLGWSRKILWHNFEPKRHLAANGLCWKRRNGLGTYFKISMVVSSSRLWACSLVRSSAMNEIAAFANYCYRILRDHFDN